MATVVVLYASCSMKGAAGPGLASERHLMPRPSRRSSRPLAALFQKGLEVQQFSLERLHSGARSNTTVHVANHAEVTILVL